MIIAFSGIDSSGKTTQIDLFEKTCKGMKLRVKKIWGKGRGTPGVMLIKGIVRGDRRMSPDEKKENNDIVGAALSVPLSYAVTAPAAAGGG